MSVPLAINVATWARNFDSTTGAWTCEHNVFEADDSTLISAIAVTFDESENGSGHVRIPDQPQNPAPSISM